MCVNRVYNMRVLLLLFQHKDGYRVMQLLLIDGCHNYHDLALLCGCGVVWTIG